MTQYIWWNMEWLPFNHVQMQKPQYVSFMHATIFPTEWVTFFLSQLTNVNRFSKGETTETANELPCFMVSD